MATITEKKYKCTQCGHEVLQNTNHFGPTWSFGRTNVCPKCPPYKKYSEFGGQTIWECMETKPEEEKE
jgi:DNA-directed RNA polymerase subunit RPC12/RpoP